MGIIENAREVASLAQQMANTELYRKIVDLEGEVVELAREKRELEDELEQVRASQAIIDTLVFDSPFYRTEDGSQLYCARCIEADQKAIHVTKNPGVRMKRVVWTCPECKTEFVDMRSG